MSGLILGIKGDKEKSNRGSLTNYLELNTVKRNWEKRKNEKEITDKWVVMGCKSAGTADSISLAGIFLTTADSKSITLTQRCLRRLAFHK